MRFKPTEIATIVVALVALMGAVISSLYTYTSRSRELDIELVKIGISILRADPKESQTQGAREWAIEVIEMHSRQKFSAAARNELLQNKLGFTSGWYELGTYADDPNPRIPPTKSPPPHSN